MVFYVAIYLFACAVVIARRPDAILHAQFFAEDGRVWFADAYNFGWWAALFRPQVGYFQTLPRLGAALALLVPFSLAPLVLNVIAVAIQALPVPVLLSSRSAPWGPFGFRALLAALYLFLPNTRDLSSVVTNSQWILALVALILLVALPPRSWIGRVFDQVNVLAAMVDRHYRDKHRVICITDEPEGLDSSIQAIPQPVHFEDVLQKHPRFPSCYRRLWNFSHAAKAVLGERILAIDIDVVITGNLAPLVHRREPFVGWTDPAFGWKKVAGGLYLLRTGSRADVWDEFDPIRSPKVAAAAGCSGSDQGWMSYKLYPPPTYSRMDGVYAIKWLAPGQALRGGVKIVSTPGDLKPWDAELQRRYPWIKEHWRI